MPTPIEDQPHTVELHVEVNVYDAKDYAAAIASVEAAIERVDDIKLDDDTIVRWEAPTTLGRP